jgi:uncharacterized damage-inducible protein DinB
VADGLFDGPDLAEDDTRALLVGYLDWYRDALLRKLSGLSEAALRTHVEGVGWTPLGLVQHLTGVERRWLQWGFRAEPVVGFPPGGDAEEWSVEHRSTTEVLDAWQAQAAISRHVVATADLDERAEPGGRFADTAHAPPLIRILFHLLQEYARHVGQLDIVRQLLDGTTGE